LYGDSERAGRAFDAAIADVEKSGATGDERPDYGSALRDGAATLTLVSETGVRKQSAAKLAELVSKSRLSHQYTSTQEQSWMLMAARSLIEEGKSLELTVDGAPVTGALMRTLAPGDLAKAPLVVGNASAADVAAVVTVSGESLTPEPASAHGFKLTREFMSLEGRPLKADKGVLSLKQNERAVVVLKFEATDKAAGRVLLADRLPAGFEVENPRLVESGDANSLPWLKSLAHAEHTEFRDDRFVAALTLRAGGGTEPAPDSTNGDQTTDSPDAPAPDQPAATTPPDPAITLAYVVRAVTPGTYLLPAATIEDMYAPDRYARTEAGTLNVVGQ